MNTFLKGWLFLLFLPFIAASQVDDRSTFDLSKLSIMPIPYLAKGETYQAVYAQEQKYRIALNQIGGSFAKAGFRVIDFGEKLKKIHKDSLFLLNPVDAVSDVKAQLIKNADCDIHIEVEVTYDQSALDGDKVQLRMKAYYTATSMIISDVFEQTNRFYQVDIASLVQRAMTDCLEGFVQDMQLGLEEMVLKGQPIQINLQVVPNEEISFQSMMMDNALFKDDLPLRNFILLWLERYSKYVHCQGETDYLMVFDEVRLPIFEDDSNLYFEPSMFQVQFEKYLRSLRRPGSTAKLKVAKHKMGNTFYYTIVP
ncbi:MAG: DUF6175 family protein [Bacteroidota bacterium]